MTQHSWGCLIALYWKAEVREWGGGREGGRERERERERETDFITVVASQRWTRRPQKIVGNYLQIAPRLLKIVIVSKTCWDEVWETGVCLISLVES